MFAEKYEQIFAPDAPMAAGCPVRRQQALVDPIDYRSGVDVKQPADFMRRKDSFSFGTVGHVRPSGKKTF